MKIRIKRIAPLQSGKVLAAIYALVSLIIVPFLLIAAALSPKDSGGIPIVMAVAMPVIYIVFGFIGGIIGACIYNLVAKCVGGMDIEVEQETIE